MAAVPLSARAGASDPLSALRLDRVDSRVLLREARQIYFRFLESGYGPGEPLGIVISGGEAAGRVVFHLPVLLPDECFVPLDLLRLRGGSRNRTPRGGSSSRVPAPLRTTALRSPTPVRAAGDV